MPPEVTEIVQSRCQLGLMLLFQFFMWIRNIINLTSKFSTSCNIIFIPLLYNPLCSHFCMASIDLFPAVLSQGMDTQRYQSFNTDCLPQTGVSRAATSSPGSGSPKNNTAFYAATKSQWRMTELPWNAASLQFWIHLAFQLLWNFQLLKTHLPLSHWHGKCWYNITRRQRLHMWFCALAAQETPSARIIR